MLSWGTGWGCFTKHNESLRTVLAVVRVSGTSIPGRSWGSWCALRSRCRADLVGVCKRDQGSHPFFANEHSTGGFVRRQPAARWQHSVVLKGVWGYMWGNLSLEDSPRWDSLYTETQTPNLSLLVIVVLYLSNSSILPALPLWIHYYF